MEKKPRKLNPQQIRIQHERTEAQSLSFAQIVISIEKFKMEIDAINNQWTLSNKKFRESREQIESKLNRSKRLLRHKKEFMIKEVRK